MKKLLALLLAAMLVLSAGCASPSDAIAQTPIPLTTVPVPTPEASPSQAVEQPAQAAVTDLAPLLSMTRKDVTALYGSGVPIPYGDISDYNETGYAIYGFPCEYSKLGGLLVFYDAQPQADDAVPYYCTEAPNDPVLGIMLQQDSAAFHVNGAVAALDAEILKELSQSYNAAIEHVNGMYEYYEVVVTEGDVQYIWRSDSPEMADSVLYAQSVQADNTPTDTSINGLLLVAPVLTDNVETISKDYREDGTYREELLYDGMVSIVAERLQNVKFSQEAIADQIVSLNEGEFIDMKLKEDSDVSERLSYPAWRITYPTGANEDTRQNVDIYIQTEQWDFRFHTSTPIDSYPEYKESIESFIDSLGLFDSN